MQVSLPKSLDDIVSDFNPIDPAQYELSITKCEHKIGANSGKPYLNLELTVINDDDFNGRKIFDIVSLQESSLWKLKQLAESCGQEISDDFDTEDFIGETVTAVVTIETSEEYGDKNRVKNYC